MPETYFHSVQNVAGRFVTCFPVECSERKSETEPLPIKTGAQNISVKNYMSYEIDWGRLVENLLLQKLDHTMSHDSA
jgi:hypothetical protein